jgi:hypothetical protein
VAAVNGDPQQASHCKLTILGGAEGTLQQASMVCTGNPTAIISLNTTHLGRFTANFNGANLAPPCQATYSCLITVCGGTMVLRDSSASWVRGLPLTNLVCVVHDSKLEVHDSLFVNNHALAFTVGDKASIILHTTNISNNVVNASGAGVLVVDNASATITDSSTLQGNTANYNGGGLAAFGNGRVCVSGDTRVLTTWPTTALEGEYLLLRMLRSQSPTAVFRATMLPTLVVGCLLQAQPR